MGALNPPVGKPLDLIPTLALIVMSFYFTQTAFFTTRFDNEMANSGKTLFFLQELYNS